MEHDNKNLYLDLLIKCLINTIYEDPPTDPWTNNTFNLKNRMNGLDWPSKAHTMIGANRLKNIQNLAEIIIKDNIHLLLPIQYIADAHIRVVGFF